MALFKGGSNYHDQIRGAVREGYIVWAPLFVMYPYRDRDTGTPIPAEVRADLDLKLRNAGTSLMALESMKVIRSLDAVLARPEVDPSRVAMIGLSFGGYYSLYIAALDPRIHVVVASGCFREAPLVRESIMAGRPVDLTSPQQVALIAPRPWQIQTGVKDPAAPIESVRRTLAEARVYHPTLDYQEFDGGHEWRGDIAWTFLRQHLRK
jgi:dienelactone hydrolase